MNDDPRVEAAAKVLWHRQRSNVPGAETWGEEPSKRYFRELASRELAAADEVSPSVSLISELTDAARALLWSAPSERNAFEGALREALSKFDMSLRQEGPS